MNFMHHQLQVVEPDSGIVLIAILVNSASCGAGRVGRKNKDLFTCCCLLISPRIRIFMSATFTSPRATNCIRQKTQKTEQKAQNTETEHESTSPLPYPALQLLRAAGSISAAKAASLIFSALQRFRWMLIWCL